MDNKDRCVNCKQSWEKCEYFHMHPHPFDPMTGVVPACCPDCTHDQTGMRN